jgi:hypothetical protein
MVLAGKLGAAMSMVVAVPVLLAGPAGADTTITAADICNRYSPGVSTRVVHIGRNSGACGVLSSAAGLFSAPISIAKIMGDKHPGAYPVHPSDPFSDWIIPTR